MCQFKKDSMNFIIYTQYMIFQNAHSQVIRRNETKK